MKYKKIISVLLKILDQIQQNNEDARNGIKKSVAAIWKEEGFYSEQVFNILFLMLQPLEQRIYFRPNDNFLNSMSAVNCNDM